LIPARYRPLVIDEECRESINLKNKNYMEYMERPTRARNEAYKEARRKADKIYR
jgi:hypothetical protein